MFNILTKMSTILDLKLDNFLFERIKFLDTYLLELAQSS